MQSRAYRGHGGGGDVALARVRGRARAFAICVYTRYFFFPYVDARARATKQSGGTSLLQLRAECIIVREIAVISRFLLIIIFFLSTQLSLECDRNQQFIIFF